MHWDGGRVAHLRDSLPTERKPSVQRRTPDSQMDLADHFRRWPLYRTTDNPSGTIVSWRCMRYYAAPLLGFPAGRSMPHVEGHDWG